MFDPATALEILNKIITEPGRVGGEIKTTMARLAEALHDLIGGSVAAVWTIDSARQEFTLLATSTPVSQHPPLWLPYGRGMIGLVVQHRQSTIVSDGDSHFDDDPIAEAGFHSALVVPLLWQGELRGVLTVLDERAGRTFARHDVQLAELAGQYMASLLGYEQARAAADHFRQGLAEEQARLLHIHVAIRQMLDEPNMRSNLVEITEALQGLGWRRVVLALCREDGRLTDAELITAGTTDGDQPLLPESVWRRFLNGELENRRLNGLYYVPCDPNATVWQTNDLLFAPLRVGQGRIAGVIRLDDPADTGTRPTVESLRSADILVSQAAYIVENARLLEETSRTAEALAEQVDELSMIHRADRELSAHLNVDRILTLTMNWVLRRTRADTGLLALMSEDRGGLVPLITMGYLDDEILACNDQNPWPLDRGIIGLAARTGETKVLRGDVPAESAVGFSLDGGVRALLAVPLAMRGEVLGVITLASGDETSFNEHEASFLERLARRAAVALDNARLFRQAEQLADDLAVLYSASRAITATLDRNEVLQRIAQSMAVALDCSSAVILNYLPDVKEGRVMAVYKVGTAHNAHEVLPDLDSTMNLKDSPTFVRVIEQQRAAAIRAIDPATPESDRSLMLEWRVNAMIVAPLVAQSELIGLVIVIEGRQDRRFTANEVFKVETLASQASVALRQSMLYSEVLELEKLKSEMIRMASHDLRNPLNNIMGYIELVAMSMSQYGLTPDQEEYIGSLRRSTKNMQSLIEDLLTLERIESDRSADWQVFDLGGLVMEVVEAEKPSAALKDQTLVLEREPAPPVFGSMTQLRQAVANLVTNAIKYTPEGGRIEVYFGEEAHRLSFKVVDNGYGISPERQARLFERFYRAREPGTDHIPGTGLGLSLVKTVIDRHGGHVWFESAVGQGSTFGFRLPPAPPDAGRGGNV